VRAEEGELLRLRDERPEQTYFKILNVYPIRRPT